MRKYTAQTPGIRDKALPSRSYVCGSYLEAHREDVIPELHRVDDRPVAFDHTLLLEAPDPVVNRGGSEPRHPGEVAQADLIVSLELFEDDAIRRFDVLDPRGPFRLRARRGKAHLNPPPRGPRTLARSRTVE